MTEEMWVVMKLRSWSDFEMKPHPLPYPVTIEGWKGSIGFLEVYATHEAAVAAADNGDVIMPVQASKREGETE